MACPETQCKNAMHAKRCMDALDRNGQDITMLWMLSAPTKWLMHCKSGAELCDWIRNTMQVPLSAAQSGEFQAEVSKEFRSRGIRPVAPARVVDAGKKDMAKQLCLAARWPRPCFPVLLQLRPPGDKGGAWGFVMCSSWQDAAVTVAEISRTKRYEGRSQTYTVGMVYEMQLVDMDGYDLPCRIILDCDAKPSEFGNAYTVEALQRIIDGVPEWFVQRLVEIKAIPAEHRVVVVEKEKSRPNKASRHYIFSIMGFSTWDTQAVLRAVFPPKKDDGDEGRLPTCDRLVDRVPHHGRGQYSVLGFFDVGKQETEYPCITRRLEIVNGKIRGAQRAKALDRSRSGLGAEAGQDALRRLQETCYSFLKSGFITMSPAFMTQLNPAKRLRGASCSAKPRNGAPLPSSEFLPSWLQSGITAITGRAGFRVNTSMHSLGPIHDMLARLVPGVRREDVAHVAPAIFCPCLACKGVIKVHEKNGTFVALADDGGVLYARCADWTCRCSEEDLELGWMDPVAGSGQRPWVRITPASIKGLVEKVRASTGGVGVQPGRASTGEAAEEERLDKHCDSNKKRRKKAVLPDSTPSSP